MTEPRKIVKRSSFERLRSYAPSAKLGWPQAQEIRKRVAAGENRKALADEYGVSTTTISHIATGRTYKKPPGREQP
jgi:DNA-binding XRE family transcriptional regulator